MYIGINQKLPGWAILKVIHSLNGARESFKSGDTDVFFWEKYTTQPFVDNGEMRRIGEYPTPWPCFVIAASEEGMKEKNTLIHKVLRIVYDEITLLTENPATLIETIATEYHLKPEQVKKWYQELDWATIVDPKRLIDDILLTQKALLHAKVVDKELASELLCRPMEIKKY